MAPELGEYPAFTRGCAFLVAGSMLPVLGWFAFAPIILIVSFGSGCRSLLRRSGVPPIINPHAI
jgi:hypothetical protein